MIARLVCLSVVNTDGSLSRIHNWATMSADEQERTARLIIARNEKRRSAIKPLSPPDIETPSAPLPLEDAPH